MLPTPVLELETQQQFALTRLRTQLASATKEQVIDFCIDLQKHLFIQKNNNLNLIKNWSKSHETIVD